MDVSSLDHCVRPPSSADDGSARLATESDAAGVLGRLLEDSDVYGSMPDMGSPELPVPAGLVLRPFRGVRFAVDDPAKVTSPPYDLISDDDVRALLHSHPNNVVRLILPRPTTPPVRVETPSDTSEAVPAHGGPVGTPDAREAADDAQRHPEDASRDAGRRDMSASETPGTDAVEEPNPDSPQARPTSTTETSDANTPQTRGMNRPGEPDAHSPQTGDAASLGAQDANSAQARHTSGTETPDANIPRTRGADSPVGAGATTSPVTRDEGSPDEHGFAQRMPGVDGTRYAEARDTLRAWLDAGILVTDDLPALYVYEQSGPTVLQRGLIGDVGIADPTQGVILPHEHVFPGPVADRLALMSTTQANLEPIFLLYDGNDGQATRLVDEVATTREPLVVARTEDGLTHRLWAITDSSEIAAINADLRPRQALIADGHHRYATYRVLQRQEHTARAQTGNPTTAPTRPPLPAEQPSPGASRILNALAAQDAVTPHDASPDHSAWATLTPSAGSAGSKTHDASASEAGSGSREASADDGEPKTPRASAGEGETRTPQASAGESEPTPAASTRGDETATRVTSPGDGTSSRAVAQGAPEQAETGRPLSGPWDFGLALLVDATAYPPDLKAIHRVVPGLPLAEAVSKARGSWRVHEYPDLAAGLAALDAAPGLAFLVAGEGGAHLLTDPDPMQLARAMPADRSDRWNALNTSILTEFLMPKVWGVRDDDQMVRIVHHDAHAAMEQAVQAGGTAVILKPLLVAEVLAVAASGERVPRKSTSFGPKPRTGLVLRTFATG
ncbi:DUF1015 family protein [Nonomuraea roseoviolacea]|uniref:DUF1015 family protein n=1 Tax=Nonomuraea roseoviolacea TaxID=103837 RepID=UPI0031D88C2E